MIDYTSLKTIPLVDRHHKVKIEDFGSPVDSLLDSLPDILAGKSFKDIIRSLLFARGNNRGRIWSFGAHVIKCGLAPTIGKLMSQGYVSHIALNGAGIVHDFEIAFHGQTSECVEQSIKDGSFGMAKETSEILGRLISSEESMRKGIGQTVAEYLVTLPHKKYSLLAHAFWNNIPVSVHPALGTDVLHYHPSVNWGNVGAASEVDFNSFAESLKSLNDGGVYLNVGSAVMLPEIFLKCLSVLRNTGYSVDNFTSVVFDMIDHYRPRENVARRPGGRGHVVIGHHEIMIPLLVHCLQ